MFPIYEKKITQAFEARSRFKSEYTKIANIQDDVYSQESLNQSFQKE